MQRWGEVRHLKVGRDRDGQRIDNLLMAELKGVPRSLVYRLIRKGQVRINGGRCKPMQKVCAGDEVRIPPVRTGSAAPAPKFSAEQLVEIRNRTLFEDDRYLVIDKPAGMAVHAGSGLAWGVIDLLRQARSDEFLELAHRLDRETSGCLILARSRQALLDAHEALKHNRVDKRYLCLLAGDLAEEPVHVDVPLRRNVERGGERLVVVDPDGGKRAVTDFRPLERYREWTLTEATIATGRTHQIRVHAQHIGHPIAGDDKYGAGTPPAGLSRLFLHCSLVAFDLQEQDYALSASAPLPEALRSVLDRLASRG